MKSKESGVLAQVYAEALYDVAMQAGILAQVEEELLTLQQALRRDVLAQRFLDSPSIPAEAKRRVLSQGLTSVSSITRNFLCVLIGRRRLGLLDRIVEALHQQCNDKAGIAEMVLESASALSPGERAKLNETLEAVAGRRVLLRERVRPELLGGFVVRHQDWQWEQSVASRLVRLAGRLKATREALGVWRP